MTYKNRKKRDWNMLHYEIDAGRKREIEKMELKANRNLTYIGIAILVWVAGTLISLKMGF